MNGPLVTTEWLAGSLGAPDLVVFDATMYLPQEGRDAKAEFGRAHILGARFFDIDLVADADTDLPHMVPSAGRFARLVGGMGVSNASRVVFYDQKGIFSSARGWWLFGLFGHDRVAVLDGGLPKWRGEGHPVEAGEPEAPAPATFVASFRGRRLAGLGDLLAEEPARIVLDARAAARFAGTAPEPRPGMASGHIPGSRSLPYTELQAPDGTMLSPEAIRARLAAGGVDGSRPVVTSCGSGVTATILTLGMALAGLPPGAVYDGSWTEWGGRADTPKETG